MKIKRSLSTLTGDSCGYCGAQTRFVPARLVELEDGEKVFTVARETYHEPHCAELDVVR